MRCTGILAVVICGLLAAPAAAQLPPIPTVIPPVPTVPPIGEQGPEPQAYQANDGKGFRDILPSGTRGLYNVPQLAAFLATGAKPPHCCDQLGDVRRPRLRDARACRPPSIPKYFKDSSFGVPAGQVERTLLPRARTSRSCATRASASRTSTARRATARCSASATSRAEDRLFFMDVLRHAGRAQLSSFAGGANIAPWTRSSGRSRPTPRPTSSSRTTSRRRALRPRSARTISADADNYIAGINQYIAEAQARPDQDAGRVRRDRPAAGPGADWKRDRRRSPPRRWSAGSSARAAATSSQSAPLLQARAGRASAAPRASASGSDFRSADDPEAPTTVHGKALPLPGAAAAARDGRRARSRTRLARARAVVTRTLERRATGAARG